MQITIVQAEIELAIKQYILSQINVREDTTIDIELKATRGDTGFQAVIVLTSNLNAPWNTAAVSHSTTAAPNPASAAEAVQQLQRRVTPVSAAHPPSMFARPTAVAVEEDEQSIEAIKRRNAERRAATEAVATDDAANDTTDVEVVAGSDAEAAVEGQLTTGAPAEAAPAAEPVPLAQSSGPKSLFKGLRKPVNQS